MKEGATHKKRNKPNHNWVAPTSAACGCFLQNKAKSVQSAKFYALGTVVPVFVQNKPNFPRFQSKNEHRPKNKPNSNPISSRVAPSSEACGCLCKTKPIGHNNYEKSKRTCPEGIASKSGFIGRRRTLCKTNPKSVQSAKFYALGTVVPVFLQNKANFQRFQSKNEHRPKNKPNLTLDSGLLTLDNLCKTKPIDYQR
jgi:hypothetical protein